jgi:hypothetical protein
VDAFYVTKSPLQLNDIINTMLSADAQPSTSNRGKRKAPASQGIKNEAVIDKPMLIVY